MAEMGSADRADLDRAMFGTKYVELRALSEDELVRRADLLMTASPGLTRRPEDYIDELVRRDAIRHNLRLQALTTRLDRLTRALVALAVVTAILIVLIVGIALLP
jgi:hypothetical protein